MQFQNLYNQSSLLISIVSHHQNEMVCNLLQDFEKLDYSNLNCTFVITINAGKLINKNLLPKNLNIEIIKNNQVKGFGKNHNFAFKQIESDYFIVCNPDIRIKSFNLNKFLESFSREKIAAVGPKVLDLHGNIEDSKRKFPSFFNLFSRKFFAARDDYKSLENHKNIFHVDWLAGMFVAFDSKKFKEIKGFDERYFLYLEDADICRRLKSKSEFVLYNGEQSVIHDARRDSGRNINYFFMHLKSMLRFLFNL